MRRFFCLIPLCLLAASCGGDDDDTTDPAAIDDLADQVIAARCEAEVACHAYADLATCIASSRATSEDLKALVAAGKVTFHPEHADACIAAVGQVFSCSAGERLQGAQSGLAGCIGLFEGTLADGEICHAAEECVSHRCAKPTSCMNAQCCTGTCAAADELAGVGESCASAGCVPEAYCQRDDSGNRTTCAARIADGQPCAAFDACQGPNVCAEGTCRRLPAAGETCSPTLPCDALDHVCGAENQCVPLARLGEACVVDETGHNCVANAYCAQDKCVANPAAGQACEQAGPSCLGDLECAAGTCTLPPDEACQVSAS